MRAQGGDIESKDGEGGQGLFSSTQGEGLKPENFLLHHSMPGVVSLVPKGENRPSPASARVTPPPPQTGAKASLIGRRRAFGPFRLGARRRGAVRTDCVRSLPAWGEDVTRSRGGGDCRRPQWRVP